MRSAKMIVNYFPQFFATKQDILVLTFNYFSFLRIFCFDFVNVLIFVALVSYDATLFSYAMVWGKNNIFFENFKLLNELLRIETSQIKNNIYLKESLKLNEYSIKCTLKKHIIVM